jgi:hypothetical protein
MKNFIFGAALVLDRVWQEIKQYWFVVVIVLCLSVGYLITKTLMDFGKTKPNAEQVTMLKKRNEILQAQELVAAKRAEELEQVQVIIIEHYKNERSKVFSIPGDSLQFYADSLYGANGN